MSGIRVISGKARGRKLRLVPGDSTRPITDRVKEALFNIIGTDVVGSAWLDLFAGTGSVGIEALSRGASYARFNDLNRKAVQTIRANLEITGLADQAEISRLDAITLLGRVPDRRFDYIYVAPPQYRALWSETLAVLDRSPGWYRPDSWVIVQIDPREDQQESLQNLDRFDQRRYGNTLLIFYTVQ